MEKDGILVNVVEEVIASGLLVLSNLQNPLLIKKRMKKGSK